MNTPKSLIYLLILNENLSESNFNSCVRNQLLKLVADILSIDNID